MSESRVTVYALLISFLSHLIGLLLFYIFMSSPKFKEPTSIEISLIEPIRRRPFRPLIHPLLTSLASSTSGPEDMKLDFSPTLRLSRPTFSLPVDISLSLSDQGFESDFTSISSGEGESNNNMGGNPIRLELRRDRPPPIKIPHPSQTLLSLAPPPGDKVMDIGAVTPPLERLGDRISEQTRGGLDLVLVVDTSESMENDIAYIVRHLEEMLGKLEKTGIDFRVIVVQFRYSPVYAIIGRDVLISKPMRRCDEVRKVLERIKCRANERALDALWKAANEINFRNGVERRFIFITDEYVSGEHKPSEVIELILRKRIRVDVIGLNDPFQRSLASITGGMWLPIWKLKSYD